MAEKATSFVVDFNNVADKPQKSGNPKKSGKTLVGAVRSKYCAEEGSQFSYITVYHGRHRKTSSSDDAAELEYLTNVCLSNCNISRSGLEKKSILSVCPNVVDLDISGNKLDSWREILPVMEQLKSLKFLNIARNTVTKDKDVLYMSTWKLPDLENLVLNETSVGWEELLHLSKLLPSLKELHICGNNYTEIPSGKHDGLHCVECLRLNSNRISSWDQLWRLHHLPKLKSLIVSGNPLTDIFYRSGQVEGTCTCYVSHGNQANHLHGNLETNKNSETEAMRDDVRQYCENILNSVIDEVIKAEVQNSEEIPVENFEKAKPKVDKNACENSKKIDSVTAIGSSPTEMMVGQTNRRVVGNVDKELDQQILEEFSKEIVERVLQRACEVVSNNTMEVENIASDICITKPENQKRPEKYANIQDNGRNKFLNSSHFESQPVGDKKIDFSKGENSCCTCKEEPVCAKPFISLESLCISETNIGKWKHLSAIREFPALKSVRIKNVKLGSKLSDEDRRKLFIASLPNIKLLNGSEVTLSEREKSERHLLRHFCEKKQKPDIYHVLEQKHGTIAPLVDIDISRGYTDYATLVFYHQGKEVFSETVCLREPTGCLRKFVQQNMGGKAGYSTLYHKHCNQRHEHSVGELEEIRCDALPLSRLDILDGDEIHIDDTKQLPQSHTIDHYFKFYTPRH